MIATPERRAAHLQVRAKGRRLEGYAALFGVRAKIGSFQEEIRQGAFGASLRSARDMLALVDHDPSRLLARTRSGTLRLAEDSTGLSFELDVPDTTEGRDILALAERGDLGGMSFGFSVPAGGETRVDGVRVLEAVNLYEISVVTAFPAYEGTRVSARTACAAMSAAQARRALFLMGVR